MTTEAPWADTDVLDRLRGCGGDPSSEDIADAIAEIQRLRGERERIAQAIEALPIYNGGEYDITPSYSLGYQLARKHGARIARADS